MVKELLGQCESEKKIKRVMGEVEDSRWREKTRSDSIWHEAIEPRCVGVCRVSVSWSFRRLWLADGERRRCVWSGGDRFYASFLIRSRLLRYYKLATSLL